jgi:hypothetical protein
MELTDDPAEEMSDLELHHRVCGIDFERVRFRPGGRDQPCANADQADQLSVAHHSKLSSGLLLSLLGNSYSFETSLMPGRSYPDDSRAQVKIVTAFSPVQTQR